MKINSNALFAIMFTGFVFMAIFSGSSNDNNSRLLHQRNKLQNCCVNEKNNLYCEQLIHFDSTYQVK